MESGNDFSSEVMADSPYRDNYNRSNATVRLPSSGLIDTTNDVPDLLQIVDKPQSQNVFPWYFEENTQEHSELGWRRNHEVKMPRNRKWVETHPSLTLFTSSSDYVVNENDIFDDNDSRLRLYQTCTADQENFYYTFDTLDSLSSLKDSVDRISVGIRINNEYNTEISRSLNQSVEFNSAFRFVVLMPDGTTRNYACPLRLHDGDDLFIPTMNIKEVHSKNCSQLWIPKIMSTLLLWNADSDCNHELRVQKPNYFTGRFFEDKDYLIYMFYNCPDVCEGNNYNTVPFNAYATVLACIFGLIRPGFHSSDQDAILADSPQQEHEFHIPSGPVFFIKVDKQTKCMKDFSKVAFKSIIDENYSHWIADSTAMALIRFYFDQDPYNTDKNYNLDNLHYRIMDDYINIQEDSVHYHRIRDVISKSIEYNRCYGRFSSSSVNEDDFNPIYFDRGYLACAILLLRCPELQFPIVRSNTIFKIPNRSDLFTTLLINYPINVTEEKDFMNPELCNGSKEEKAIGTIQKEQIVEDRPDSPTINLDTRIEDLKKIAKKKMKNISAISTDSLQQCLNQTNENMRKARRWNKKQTSLSHEDQSYIDMKKRYAILKQLKGQYEKEIEKRTRNTQDEERQEPSKRRKESPPLSTSISSFEDIDYFQFE